MNSLTAALRLCWVLLLLPLSNAGSLVCTATLFSHSDYFGQPAAQLSLRTEGRSSSVVVSDLAGSQAGSARRLLMPKDTSSVASLHLVCHCTTSSTDLCTQSDFRKVKLRLYTRPSSDGGGEVQDVSCSRLEQLEGRQSCATGIRLTRESLQVAAAALLFDMPDFQLGDSAQQHHDGDSARSGGGISRALRGQQA